MPLARLLAAIERIPPRRALLVLLLFHVAIHLRYLNLPPVGFHLWRQCDTLSVARNFYEQGMNFFEPRVDRCGAGSGVTGSEFPLVTYLMALGYRAFGYGYWVQRLVVLLLSLIAVAGCFRFTQALLGSTLLAAASSLILVLSPLFVYYSVVAMPDVPMLGFLFLGLAGLTAWSRGSGTRHALWGIGALGLGTLIKLSAAAAWPAALVLSLRGWGRSSGPQRWIVAAAAAVAVAAVGAWYAHARALSEIHHSRIFLLSPMFPYPAAVVPRVLKREFLEWLPELFLNYASFVWFAIGIASLGGSASVETSRFSLAYAVSLGGFMVAVLPMLEMHDYYMVAALPLLVPIATLGFGRLWAAAARRPSAALLAATLLAAAVILGPIRGLSRLEGRRPPAGLETIAPALDRMIPDRRERVIAASDPSPDIFLYFMHRRGWSATSAVGAEEFEDMAAQGARYLISSSRDLETRPEIARHLRQIGSHERFNVFRIVR